MLTLSLSGDLYGASELPAIIDRAREEVGIRQQCDQLQIIPTHLPNFTASCGYEWVTQPESYDSTAEAAFQRRALMMLGKLWVESPHHERLVEKISKIIVTQEFVTKFGLCSPRIIPSRTQVDYRILSIPSGFVELANWVFSGLRCWAARELGLEADDADDGGWTIACTPAKGRDARPFLHATTYELIARTLADAGRDLELYGDNAALLIREQVSELKGARLENSMRPRFTTSSRTLPTWLLNSPSLTRSATPYRRLVRQPVRRTRRVRQKLIRSPARS